MIGTGCLAVIGLIVLIIGAVMHSKSKTCAFEPTRTPTEPPNPTAAPSTDSKTLLGFITKVKETYYKTHSQNVIQDPEMDTEQIIDNFNPYDPTPSEIKKRTDVALGLMKELNSMTLDSTKLKPRERKALAQLRHYLQSNFGQPYDENYYAGDWMLGPNYFCWQPICSVVSDIKSHYKIDGGFKPDSVEDVEKVVESIKKSGKAFKTYQANMVAGVAAGMVRSRADCEAGRNKFVSSHRNIADDGKTGTLLVYLIVVIHYILKYAKSNYNYTY